MAQYGKIGFDFDHWATLAKTDPEGFERKRSEVIQSHIDNSPEHLRQRLKGLQWQVDSVRQTSSNPMAACLKISGMMWKSVLEEDGLLDNLNSVTQATSIKPQQRKQKPAATVLSINSMTNRLKDD